MLIGQLFKQLHFYIPITNTRSLCLGVEMITHGARCGQSGQRGQIHPFVTLAQLFKVTGIAESKMQPVIETS